ncbi:MAG: stage II sporulation protein P [Oscillospiraceae bacterium]|nr:stage II sporulation protein P [Oscillospiraceae bacterium]
MKKTVVGTVLGAVILRLAMLSGAGEVLGTWVRESGVDERLVAAAVDLELGGVTAAGRLAKEAAPAPEQTEREEPAEPGEPAAEREEAGETGDIPASPAPSPVLRLVSVAPTPVPAPETEPEAEAEKPVYALDGTAELRNRTEQEIDVQALAQEGLSLTLPADGPQVLIIHTHSSEAYAQDAYDRYEASDPYRTEDPAYSVIRVGEVLAERFRAQGLTVLHDCELYDYPSYTGSYTRSGEAVERYLAEYPSLRVVLDVHRDAIGSGDVVYKTSATLDGRSSAQVMLVCGTGENGLWHPNWRENLKLALYLQNAARDRWPTLTRPIALVKERYNQQLSTGMLILEVGSTGNTLREAVAAAESFGDAAGAALAKLVV